MKKIICNLMVILMLLALFPVNVFAANDTKIVIQHDSANSKYLVYPSKACTYELSDSDSVKPAAFNQIYDDASDVIEVLTSNITSGIARYLWIEGNDQPYDLQSHEFITESVINRIDSTMKRISIKPVAKGDRVIVLTKKENYSNYRYIIKKVEKGSDYDQLVVRAESLDPSISIIEPYTGITRMLDFKTSYDALLPTTDDVRWQAVPENATIEEPLDTKTGDIYVVWLMASDNSTPVLDMQIMYCLREDEKIVTKVEKMPYTGISYFINGLLVANLAILPVIYFKRRKLVNSK